MSAEHSSLTCSEFRGGWFDSAHGMINGSQLNVKRSIELAIHAVDCAERECRVLSSVTNQVLKARVRTNDELRALIHDLSAPVVEKEPVPSKPEEVERLNPDSKFPHRLMERMVPITKLIGREEQAQRAA